MPKIFHVNWFRVSDKGKFLWPGYGDNIRVIDWMCKRLHDEDVADKSAIGYLPKKGIYVEPLSHLPRGIILLFT